MNLVLTGPPGAGKGTQAALLARQYAIPKISTGELLRELAQRGDEEGRQIGSLIDRGQMVPDDTVQALVWEKLRHPDAAGGFLLDGFPRTVNQAEALEQFLRESGRELTAVLDLQVPEEELIRRLSGRRICPQCGASYHLDSHPPRVPDRCDRDGDQLEQRPDDQPDAIRVRLRLYRERTEPVLDYYRTRGLLQPIEGDRTMPEVTEQIRRVLEERPARGGLSG